MCLRKLQKILFIGFAVLAASLPLRVQPAEATLLVIQQWEHLGFSTNGLTLRTGARFDDTSFTGTGTEKFLLFQFNVISLANGIAQSSEVAVFTDLPSLSVESNIFAQFTNGIFAGLFSVQTGGSARTPLVQEVTGADFGNNLVIGGGELVYFVNEIFRQDYRLLSSTFTDLNPNPVPDPVSVPEPAALPIFFAGLIALGFFGRRASLAIRDLRERSSAVSS
jgi:hypothetical protein